MPVIHVSPHGEDGAAGTRSDPIGSLDEARRRVRIARAAGLACVVELAAGRHTVRDTLRLGPADSGTADHPVLWRAEPGAEVVLAGGRRLRPTWERDRGEILRTRLEPGLAVDQMFADGRRQTLARYPDREPGQVLDGYAADALAPERTARWSDPSTALVRALHAKEWGGTSFRVRGRDADGLQLDWVGDNQRGAEPHPSYRMVENVAEELDAAGEWWYDRGTGHLFWWPPPSTDPQTAEIELAELSELIRVAGDGPERPAHDISFDGLTFARTHRTIFTGGYEPVSMSDWSVVRSAALVLSDSERMLVRDCTFDEVGGNGVFVDGYAREITIADNVLSRCGASGVVVMGRGRAARDYSTWQHRATAGTDTTPGPQSEDHPREVAVIGNHVVGMGQFEKQAAGVAISLARRVVVAGNTIHHGPRAGINIGDGTWGGHQIVDNDLFDLVRETGDHGPINAWGRDRFWVRGTDDAQRKALALTDAVEPTVIAHNRIWHSSAWGIDLDDGCTHYLLRDNLLLNTGIKLREGYHRVVQNNVLVGGSIHFHVGYPDSEDRVLNNVILGRQPYRFVRTDPEVSRILFAGNVVFNNGDPVTGVDGPGRAGHGAGSLVADPGLLGDPWADPGLLDYSLADDGLAARAGIRSIRPSGFGRPDLDVVPPAVTWSLLPATITAPSLAEPWLGALVCDIWSTELASSVGLTRGGGCYLVEVPPNSPADRAGLQAGDVITSVGAQDVHDKAELWRAWLTIPPAEEIRLGLWRDQARLATSLRRPGGVERINNTALTYQGDWRWRHDDSTGTGETYLGDVHLCSGEGVLGLDFHGRAFVLNGVGADVPDQLGVTVDDRVLHAWTTTVDGRGRWRLASSDLGPGRHRVRVSARGADGRPLVVDSVDLMQTGN